MNSYDYSKLNDYAERMMSRFLTAFSKEAIYLLDNSENYFIADGDRFIGAWVIEWLCPAGGYDWNVRLRSSEHQLTIYWGNDHEHFGNWDRIEGDPEAETCLVRLAEIFDEKLWNVSLYQGDKPFSDGWCGPDEVDALILSSPVMRYEIKTWRGTFDKMVSRNEGYQP